MIGDPKRGYLLELLLNKLLLLQSVQNLDLQIICLSATLPNIQQIVNYTNAVCFVATQRPNQLTEYIIVSEDVHCWVFSPVGFVKYTYE